MKVLKVVIAFAILIAITTALLFFMRVQIERYEDLPTPPAVQAPTPMAASIEASAIPTNPTGGPIPPGCMPSGKVPGFPSADNRIRLYNKGTCSAMGGTHIPNGECLRKAGGSFSWDCRGLNPIPLEEQCSTLYPPSQL